MKPRMLKPLRGSTVAKVGHTGPLPCIVMCPQRATAAGRAAHGFEKG
jgi:hypothetical protein